MELLEVITGSDVRTATLLAARMTIGRAESNDVVVNGDAGVSREHAALEKIPGGWQVIDLHSTNGTYVNGKPVTAPTPVGPGDRIQLGKAEIKFTSDQTETAMLHFERASHAIENGGLRISVRERKILGLLGKGLTDAEIARQLGVAESLVRAEIEHLTSRTGTPSRIDLARVATQLGIS